MEQNNFDLKKVKAHRTAEATILEVVFAIVAIIVWGLIIWMIRQAPDIVPTHFDSDWAYLPSIHRLYNPNL